MLLTNQPVGTAISGIGGAARQCCAQVRLAARHQEDQSLLRDVDVYPMASSVLRRPPRPECLEEVAALLGQRQSTTVFPPVGRSPCRPEGASAASRSLRGRDDAHWRDVQGHPAALDRSAARSPRPDGRGASLFGPSDELLGEWGTDSAVLESEPALFEQGGMTASW